MIIQAFQFVASMFTQIINFWFAIDLGGVTIGSIYFMMFLVTVLFAVMFQMIGISSKVSFTKSDKKGDK